MINFWKMFKRVYRSLITVKLQKVLLLWIEENINKMPISVVETLEIGLRWN